MKRHGAVLVFKKDVTAAQAAIALQKIADVLDLPDTSYVYKKTPTGFVSGHKRFEMVDKINDFDDDIGGPVWYIP